MSTESKTQTGAATTEASGSLLDELLADAKYKPGDEGFALAKKGV